MIVDSKFAIMSEAEFAALPKYSCSLPTGAYEGKRWKRDCHEFHRKEWGPKPKIRWQMGEYGPHPNPEKVSILWTEIVVLPKGKRTAGSQWDERENDKAFQRAEAAA